MADIRAAAELSRLSPRPVPHLLDRRRNRNRNAVDRLVTLTHDQEPLVPLITALDRHLELSHVLRK